MNDIGKCRSTTIVRRNKVHKNIMMIKIEDHLIYIESI